MARKTRNSRTTRTSRARPAPRMDAAQALSIARSSARKAIDAGAQAATIARQSAVGAFDALVKQGAAIESATRKAAIEQVRKARRSAIRTTTGARDAALAGAEAARTRTVEAVSHLERVFEQRVSRVISKMGVPTTKDVRALSRQVAQLQTSVESLRRSRARARAA